MNYYTINKYFFKYLFKYEIENIEILENLKGSFIVLTNHFHNINLQLTASVFSQKVMPLSTDIFKVRNLKPVWAGLRGPLSFKYSLYNKADVATVLHKIQKNNFALFPDESYFLENDKKRIHPRLIAFIKSLNLPVVIVLCKGVEFALPAWGDKIRRGKLILEFKNYFNKNYIKQSDHALIQNDLLNSLLHDDYAYQAEHKFQYISKSRAEFLERLLFLCPHCNAVDTLKSNKNFIICQKCGYSCYYTEEGRFISKTGLVQYPDVPLWLEWQKKYLKNILLTFKYEFSENTVIFKNTDVLMYPNKNSRKKKIQHGSLKLFSDRIIFYTKNKNIFVFKIIEIKYMQAHKNKVIHIYYHNILYCFQFYTRIALKKWIYAVEILQNTNR